MARSIFTLGTKHDRVSRPSLSRHIMIEFHKTTVLGLGRQQQQQLGSNMRVFLRHFFDPQIGGGGGVEAGRRLLLSAVWLQS